MSRADYSAIQNSEPTQGQCDRVAQAMKEHFPDLVGEDYSAKFSEMLDNAVVEDAAERAQR